MPYFIERDFDVKAQQLASKVLDAMGDYLEKFLATAGPNGSGGISWQNYKHTNTRSVVNYRFNMRDIPGLPELPPEIKHMDVDFRKTRGQGAAAAFGRPLKSAGDTDDTRMLSTIYMYLPLAQLNRMASEPKKVLAQTGVRSTFTHEFAHFLDWTRRKKVYDLGKAPDDALTPELIRRFGPMKAVKLANDFNKPNEVLAYGTGIPSEVLIDAKRTKNGLAKLKAGGLQEFTKRVLATGQGRNMMNFLTPANKKIFLKHIAQFWYAHPELSGPKAG